MFDIVGRRKWAYVVSALILAPSILSLIIFRLQLGIDFSGGTIYELRFASTPPTEAIKRVYLEQDLGEPLVQATGEGSVIVRSKELGLEEKQAVRAALEEEHGQAEELRFEAVGPVIARELTQRAILAVLVASVGILVYITWAFRHVPQPFRYGVCAICALVHDVLVVLGVFSVLGFLVNKEIDSMFITAILTAIGYSVHDTIVVFDRVRENRAKYTHAPLPTVVNFSVNQTIDRSLNTSITLLITLFALYLFGGLAIKDFVLALLIGTATGTYSSIFIAASLLVDWDIFSRRQVEAT